MEATMDINRVIGESEESRREFLTNRRTGIGGSDVAAIFELSKWKCAMDIYLDKTGQLEESEAKLMLGIILQNAFYVNVDGIWLSGMIQDIREGD